MKVALTGSHDGQRWPPIGGVVELSDVSGAHLCANGQAVPVVDDPVETAVIDDDDVETATSNAAETAVVVDDAEERTGLTTETGPTPRKRARPRKNPE